MNLPQIAILRIVSIIVVIFIVGTVSLEDMMPQALNSKPQLYLIPEEIRSDHFENSLPYHKQFLATDLVNIVINFDREFDKFASSVNYKNNEVANTQMINQKSTFIRQSVPPSVGDGIYIVKYAVCFEQDCSQGQFAYQIDGSLLTRFDNKTKNAPNPQVDIEIDQNSIKPFNALVTRGSTINFKNIGAVTLGIRSDPPIQNNYFPPFNSPHIKAGESFAITLDIPALYLFHLEGNPEINGQIYVQN